MNEVITNLATQFTERSETLKTDIMDLEKQLNSKKEEYFKLQGALEALQIVYNQQSPNQNSTQTTEPKA